MRAIYQNSGTALSIGVFFSLMIAGLASTLPQTLARGLISTGLPRTVAHEIAALPPVSSMFAAVLGVNPLQHLLSANGALGALPAAGRQVLTGRVFFPELISGPFHHGLVVVFSVSTALAVIAGVASVLRGGRYVHPESGPLWQDDEQATAIPELGLIPAASLAACRAGSRGSPSR